MTTSKMAKRFGMIAAAGALLALAGACSTQNGIFSMLGGKSQKAEPLPAWQKTDHGVVVTPTNGAAKKVRLEVMTDSIIRVTATPTDSLDLPKSLIVDAAPASDVKFDVAAAGDTLTLKTAKVSAEVSLSTGTVKFRDENGKIVLDGYNGGEFTPVKVDGQDFYAVRQEFNRGSDEGFYGLGQHQNGIVDYNGQDVTLAQHNMEIAMPFVMSSRNYGLLWDNYSVTHWGYPDNYPAMSSELTLTDTNGDKGGLTGSYYDGKKLVLTKVEADPNYQYVSDQKNWPEAMTAVPDARRRVVVGWQDRIRQDRAAQVPLLCQRLFQTVARRQASDG